MKDVCRFLLVLFAALSFAGCSDDDDYLPAYRQDLADVTVDGGGRVSALLLDDGTHLSVSGGQTVEERDTLLRRYVLFVEGDGGATVHSMSVVPTAAPRNIADTAMLRHPVQPRAVWRGGRYVNFRIAVPTGPSAKSHYFSFRDCGISTSPVNVRTLHLQLFHNQNGDDSAYTREAYLSCLLTPYADTLHTGDSIEVAVATEGGERFFRVPY